MREFAGKVAVITGAASGIGRAMAERFVRAGMKTVLADVEAVALAGAVAAMDAHGAQAMGVRTDVSKAEEVEALAERAFGEFGAVHVLLNNAGVASHGNPSWAQSQADWQWTMSVNFWGVVNGIRSFLPRMLARGEEGHVVNTASLAGLLAFPGNAPYGCSKFAVVALSEALHAELAYVGAKIRVSVLCPGFVRTNLLDSERNRPPDLPGAHVTAAQEAIREQFRKAMQTAMPPEEVAERVFAAVRDEQFYILTHPEANEQVRTRVDGMLAGLNPKIPAPL